MAEAAQETGIAPGAGVAPGDFPGVVPGAARKPKASHRGPLAPMQVPPGSTAGSRSSIAARHMGMEIPLVVNWGREEQEVKGL